MDRLHEAIRLLPAEDSAAYMEAVEKAPNVVRLESAPNRFLRVEKDDLQAAAVRLAKYWKYRKQIFGDRAFLPMSLTGDGALDEEDVNFISEGGTVVLPLDQMRRPVLFINTTRMPKSSTVVRKCRPRSMLFWFTKLSMDYEICQTEGCISVRFMTQVAIDVVVGAFRRGHQLLSEAMPLKMAVNHFCIQPSSKERSHVLNCSIPLLYSTLGKECRDRPLLHEGASSTDFRKVMLEYGMTPDGLPAMLGGSWSYDTFDKWIDQSRKGHLPASHDDGKVQPLAHEHARGSKVHAKGMEESVGAKQAGHKAAPGSDPPLHTHAEDITTLSKRAEIRELIRFLPEEDKAAYIAATKDAPMVVETESDPLKFLRCEDDVDTTAAARRLVKYWKRRKDVLGDRSDCPMNLLPEGALTDENIAFMGTGAIVRLPDDDEGCSVLLLDLSRIDRIESDVDWHLKVCLLYWLTRISMENSRAQTKGVAILWIAALPADVDDLRRTALYFDDAVPLKFGKLHFCCSPLSDLAVGVDPHGHSFDRRVTIHVATSENDYVPMLRKHNIREACLPTSLGGSWSHDDFFLELETLSCRRWVAEAFLGKKIAKGGDGLSCLAKAGALVVEDERKEKKRQQAVLYARGKRQRDRRDFHSLKRRCGSLHEEQAALVAEQRRLTDLLGAAKAVVADKVKPRSSGHVDTGTDCGKLPKVRFPESQSVSAPNHESLAKQITGLGSEMTREVRQGASSALPGTSNVLGDCRPGWPESGEQQPSATLPDAQSLHALLRALNKPGYAEATLHATPQQIALRAAQALDTVSNAQNHSERVVASPENFSQQIGNTPSGQQSERALALYLAAGAGAGPIHGSAISAVSPLFAADAFGSSLGMQMTGVADRQERSRNVARSPSVGQSSQSQLEGLLSSIDANVLQQLQHLLQRFKG